MSEEIKPCPFCGGDAEADLARGFVNWKGNPCNAVAIYCQNCSVEVSMCYGDYPHLTLEEIYSECLKIWNRRATASEGTMGELVDALKAFNNALYDGPENLSSRTANRLCDSAQDIITRAEAELKGGKV